jgi:hypothetical protein
MVNANTHATRCIGRLGHGDFLDFGDGPTRGGAAEGRDSGIGGGYGKSTNLPNLPSHKSTFVSSYYLNNYTKNA